MTDKSWRAEMLCRSDYSDIREIERDANEIVTRANSELDAKDTMIAELESQLEIYENPTCNGSWIGGSGGHRTFGGCGKPASYREETGVCFCDEHLPANERVRELESRIRELTEWRPIETAPRLPEQAIFLECTGGMFVGWLEGDGVNDGSGVVYKVEIVKGWLPLPEATRHDARVAASEALARAEKAESRIRELTEWVRGEPDDNTRHWALVLPDGHSTPRVMQWEPQTSRWCVSGGHYGPDECVHTVSLPGVKP